jgi:hypothetical protein
VKSNVEHPLRGTLTNVPPSKARKIKKKPDVMLEDIFSDIEIGIPHRKSSISQLFDDDDSASEVDGPFDSHLAKTQGKPKRVDTPDTLFEWTEADIPLMCPEDDCNTKIVTNPSPSLISLFRRRAQLIDEEGINADGVYHLNIKICVENKIAHDAERKHCRAVNRGLKNIDFQLLANRVWDLKDPVGLLMFEEASRSNNFIWLNLKDDIKTHRYSLERLNKGKSVPTLIVKAARPG